MNIKVYNKRGKKNYKEARLIKELELALEDKLKDDPRLALSFRPADNFEQLQAMHREYTSTEVDYVELEDQNDNQNDMNKKDVTPDLPGIDDDLTSDDNSFIDPFNRQEPTTYDYTNDGGFSKESTPKNTGQTDFAEPLSFNEAFELPEEGEEDNPVENESQSGSSNKKENSQTNSRGKAASKEEPWNSSFDDMSGANQKKSTKKFAKYIVEAVCALGEKGFVWYANKDINESKLAEYELNGEMNLSILVSLESGQEATVKHFFQQQCIAA